MNENNIGILIGLAISFILFIIFREGVCWYWKINKTIELQENILTELRKINNSKPPL